jgi:cytochrome c553
MRRALVTILLGISGSLATASPPDAADQFERHVRPVLAARCVSCHGPDRQESDLRLDSRAAILRGGASGVAAAVAGEPEESLLIAAVRHEDGWEMPPDAEPLTGEQVQALADWIQAGLPWPASSRQPAPTTAAERVASDRREHWSLQPLERPRLPAGGTEPGRRPRTRVDALVHAGLHAAGLTPGPPADRRHLVRRATFDLLGIPPAAAEVERFLQDRREDAWPRLVERLLASPHYGERWGRHWLDVARYADTRGYAFARDRRYPYAYTYRDYVIHALNQDLPYDRFVLEQLAADQLELGADNGALAALGFLTVGRKFNNRHDDIDDQIDVVTRGLLGLTVACARCHDHKYDAIPTEDYYSLYGVFASSHEPAELPLIGPHDQVVRHRAFVDELNRRQAALREFTDQCHETFVDQARSQISDYLVAVVHQGSPELLEKLPFLSISPGELRPRLVARWSKYLERRSGPNHPALMPWHELMQLPVDGFAGQALARIEEWREWTFPQINPLVRDALLAKPPGDRIELARLYGQLLEETYAVWKEAGGTDKALRSLPDERRQLAILIFDPATPTAIEPQEIKEYLTREQRERYNSLQKEIDRHQVHAPETLSRAMVVVDDEQPADSQVLIRGNPGRPGDQVPRRVPALLAREPRSAFAKGSGRLELAQAVVDPENPLTARVIANRVWMHHFGEPLVPTPSDFGVRSPEPAQLQLLDHLAWTLQEHGWSLKALHREIMLSATYQQSSADRPECRQVDPDNELLWRMNRRRLEFEVLRDSLLAVSDQLDLRLGGKSVDLLAAPRSRRRAVYGIVDRQDLPGLFRTFDFASPDQSAARRPRTTVPQQALFLLNAPFVIDQARAVASLPELARCASADDYVHAVYRQVLSRPATPEEIQIGVAFLHAAAEQPQAELGPRAQYAQLLMMSNEFMFID